MVLRNSISELNMTELMGNEGRRKPSEGKRREEEMGQPAEEYFRAVAAGRGGVDTVGGRRYPSPTL